MSNIASVYTAISGYSCTGVTTTRNISAAQLEVAGADLPCRILLPAVQGEGEFVNMGNLQKIEWKIRDLCLWARLGSGLGVQQYSGAMATYIGSYLTKIKAGRNPATNCTITGWDIQMGPVPWAEDDYWAVDITLTVEEII
jgi:hypothetical protein